MAFQLKVTTPSKLVALLLVLSLVLFIFGDLQCPASFDEARTAAAEVSPSSSGAGSAPASATTPPAPSPAGDFYVPTLPAPVQIPFDYKNGQIIVAVSVNNSKPLNFLVDTGASAVIIDQRTASDVGLQMEQAVTVESVAGEVAVKASHLGQLILGMLTLNQLPVLVADLSVQSKKYGCIISGIIGSRLLNKFVVAIDYGAQIMELSTNPPMQAAPGAQVIPLVKYEPPIVQGSINGRYGQLFVIDTGSSINSIPAELALRVRPPGPPLTSSGMGLDGRELHLDTCVLKTVELGAFTKNNVLCHSASATGAEKFAKGFFLSSNIGVLGNPFWQENKIILDYKEHKLFVQPGTVQGTRREIMDALAQGDAALIYHRQYRQAERYYNQALAKVNFAHDSKYEAIALDRAANLKRIMSKELNRPEHSKAAYDFFVKALDAARAIGDRDVEARILADWSLLYSDNGQDMEAWQMIQTALQLAPDNVQVMVNQSVLLFRSANYSDMQSLLREVLAQDPSNWEALWYQVKLDELSNSRDNLSYTLKQILQYYPWSRTAKDMLTKSQQSGEFIKQQPSSAQQSGTNTQQSGTNTQQSGTNTQQELHCDVHQ